MSAGGPKATTLADFLLARYSEAEVAMDPGHPIEPVDWAPTGDPVTGYAPMDTGISGEQWHMCVDPQLVLEDIAAKRQILQLHGENSTVPGKYNLTCWVDHDDFPCTTVRILGLPYAEHPDYRKEWRP